MFYRLKKAFDRIRRYHVWKSMEQKGVKSILDLKIENVKSLYMNNKYKVRMTRVDCCNSCHSFSLEAKVRLTRGCILSPCDFP